MSDIKIDGQHDPESLQDNRRSSFGQVGKHDDVVAPGGATAQRTLPSQNRVSSRRRPFARYRQPDAVHVLGCAGHGRSAIYSISKV